MQIRNTDQDWITMGDENPYYAVISDTKYLNENVDPAKLKEFFSYGERDIGHFVRTLTFLNGGTFAPKSALDFGCGVGRLLVPIARHVEHVIGIDVSPKMRQLCLEKCAKEGISRVALYGTIAECIRTEHPAIDWLNAYIVFQHIPPHRGYEILRDLLSLTVKNGFISLHFTFFKDRHFLQAALRHAEYVAIHDSSVDIIKEIPANDNDVMMSMYDYDLNRLLPIFIDAGFETMLIEHTDHGGCHGIIVFGKKTKQVGQSVAIGDTVWLRANLSSYIRNLKGWGCQEEWGCWSVGPVASIELPVKANVDAPLRLKLHVQAFTHLRAPTQEIEVLCKGGLIDSWHFVVGEGIVEKIIEVPEQGIDVRGTLSVLPLEFRIKSPRSPADLGISGDMRKLGLGLVSIEVLSTAF